MNLSEGLIPPDYDQCQAEIRPAHGAFRLGPRPPASRCTRAPIWLAVEIMAGSDGKHGAMTLCQTCTEEMMKDADLRVRVQLQPILTDKEAEV